MTTEQTSCEQCIDEHLRSRLDNLLPDLDDASIEQCKELLDHYGCTHLDPEDDIDDWREAAREAVQDGAMENILSIGPRWCNGEHPLDRQAHDVQRLPFLGRTRRLL